MKPSIEKFFSNYQTIPHQNATSLVPANHHLTLTHIPSSNHCKTSTTVVKVHRKHRIESAESKLPLNTLTLTLQNKTKAIEIVHFSKIILNENFLITFHSIPRDGLLCMEQNPSIYCNLQTIEERRKTIFHFHTNKSFYLTWFSSYVLECFCSIWILLCIFLLYFKY